VARPCRTYTGFLASQCPTVERVASHVNSDVEGKGLRATRAKA
jgi:hypothetical protein